MKHDTLEAGELKKRCEELRHQYESCTGVECDQFALITIRATHNVSAREFNRKKSWYQSKIELI